MNKFIYTLCICAFIGSCLPLQGKTKYVHPLVGFWEMENNSHALTFDVYIKQHKNQLYYYFYCVACNGNRMDDPLTGHNGESIPNVITAMPRTATGRVSFKSSFGYHVEATISKRGKKLYWKVTKGDSYYPKKATLIRAHRNQWLVR